MLDSRPVPNEQSHHANFTMEKPGPRETLEIMGSVVFSLYIPVCRENGQVGVIHCVAYRVLALRPSRYSPC